MWILWQSAPKRYVCALTLRVCDYDLIWKEFFFQV